tara:strand:+ start:1327 stop:3177 length:1851 start_codon:yes stop_codon:yes gene_type:complete
MDKLRSFLSGRRLAVIAILLAIPFAFFGSSSFSTSFSNFGKVNGLTVTSFDVNVAITNANARLQQIYGDDFNVELLDEGVFNALVKNEIINQKVLLSQAQKMNLSFSELDAKKQIMLEPSFQTNGLFDQNIFEATVRANGILPNEYIEYVQNTSLVGELLSAISQSNFFIESELVNQIKIIEQGRNVKYIKIDFDSLKDSINPSLEDALNFYDDNNLLFMDEEKRSFNYLSLSQNQFKEIIEIPEGFIESEYEAYLKSLNANTQRRISHIMIEVSNYDSKEEAYNVLKSVESDLAANLSFDDAVSQYSDDLVSAEVGGDLGFSSGDSFPYQFEDALDDMSLGQVSSIIELEETLHIIKFTEEDKKDPKSLEEVSNEFIEELIDAESYALMIELRDEIEDLILNGFSVKLIAEQLNLDLKKTELVYYENNDISDDQEVKDFLFNIDSENNFPEIIELNDKVIIASINEIADPAPLPFDEVSDLVFDQLRELEALELIPSMQQELLTNINEESFLSNNPNILQDELSNIKRNSTLFPQDILNVIFSSKTNETNVKTSLNSDVYIIKVLDILVPSEDEISNFLPEYNEFIDNTSLVKLNTIVDKEMNKNVRDNIINLNI